MADNVPLGMALDALCAEQREVVRLRVALQAIADGCVSPSIDFARRVLDGMTAREALEAGRSPLDY